MPLTAAEVFRDFVTDGVPSSGEHDPSKPEIRTLLGGYEQVINSFLASGGKVYVTKVTLDADLNHEAKTMAWVVGDATAASNGVYQKQGAYGTGSWTRIADLPYSFIVANDAGAGTPNSIVATSSLPISPSALVLLNIFETNTGSPVIVSFNGAPTLRIRTNSGNDIAPGGLQAGMLVMGRMSGTTFRLVSDQVASAIIAQAEAAAAEAANYAALALNNWVVDTFTGDGTANPLVLSVNPGSVNNCIVTIEGQAPQPRHIFRLENGNELYPPDGAVWPNGQGIEVAYGSAIEIDVGVPTDGSVTTPKLGASAVTEPKLATAAVTRPKVADSAINADKLASDPAEIAAIAAKLGVQTAKVKALSLIRDATAYTTTSTTLGAGSNVSRSYSATSSTSSLLVLVFFRLEMARDATAGSTGMIVNPHHYSGSAYVASDEVIELLDTSGPASHILRIGASGAIALTAAQKRTDLTTGKGQWTVLNYFRSNNAQCTAKIIRQTFVFIEFEP